MSITKVEYKVRPVTRYVVTRYYEDCQDVDSAYVGLTLPIGAGSEPKGEFNNPETAYAVAYALARTEHENLGWPVGDERIIYPAPMAFEDAKVTPIG